MFQKISVFCLAFVAGSAIAGPIGNVLGGVTNALGGASASPAVATITGTKLPGLPALGAGLPLGRAGKVAGVDAPLPGLSSEGPLGVTLLQEGADGSGYDYVLNSDQIQFLADELQPLTNDVISSGVVNTLTEALLDRDLVTQGTLLDSDHFIDDGLDNNLVTPLLGLDGDGGMIDVALFDGNGTANAGSDGLLGAALFSGSHTGNGGAIALGAFNEGFSGNGDSIGIGLVNQGPVSGNGGDIGIGVLSGEASGNGGSLGIGVLNKNDVLHVCGAGTCGSFNDLVSQGSAIPATEILPGIVIGGRGENKAKRVSASNPLLNAGVLAGDDVGNGGLIGLGVIAGNNSAHGDLAGVCVLCGNNASSGTLSVAALSGINSGNSNADDNTIPLGIGVGALNDGFSGNGTDIGVGALNGIASGNGGELGVGVLNSSLSGNGGVIGAGVLNGGGSANGGAIGVGAINGGSGPSNGSDTAGGTPGSGGGGIIGVGAINTGNGSGGGGNNGGGHNGGNNGGGTTGGGNSQNLADAGDDGLCALEVRDGKGRVAQTLKRPCKQLSKPKRATVAKL